MVLRWWARPTTQYWWSKLYLYLLSTWLTNQKAKKKYFTQSVATLPFSPYFATVAIWVFLFIFLRYAKMISWKFSGRIYETTKNARYLLQKYGNVEKKLQICEFRKIVISQKFEVQKRDNFSLNSTYKYGGTLYTLEAWNNTSWKLEFFISISKADIALYLLYICHQIRTHLKFT